MNCSLSLQVLPSVYENEIFGVVDEVIAFIASKGVKYVVCPFETVMEGDYIELFEIARQAILIAGSKGVFANIKVSYNPQGVFTIDEKISKYNNK